MPKALIAMVFIYMAAFAKSYKGLFIRKNFPYSKLVCNIAI